MNEFDRLPFRTAICVKRAKNRNHFMNMFGEDYCEVVIEEENPEYFMQKVKDYQGKLQIIYLGECAFHQQNNRDLYHEKYRNCVEMIRTSFPDSLIHLHILKESMAAYEDFFHVANIYNTLFTEARLPKKLIEERLEKHFNLSKEELNEIKRGKKKENTKQVLQMNLNDYKKTTDGEIVVTEELETQNPIEDQIYENGKETANSETESEAKGDELNSIQLVQEEKTVKSQRRKKNESQSPVKKQIDHIQELLVADDIPFGVKEQAKILVQSALATQGRYFKVKQSLRTGIREKSIAVVNLIPRSGSSFVVNNFAIALGHSQIATGVLESQQPTPQLFFKLGGDDKVPTNWECWYDNVRNNRMIYRQHNEDFSIPCIQNNHDWFSHKVHWIPYLAGTHMRNSKGMGLLDTLAIYYTADSLPVLLVDLSHDFESGFQRLILEEVDELWIVVEPDVNLLRYQSKRVKQLISFSHTNEIFFILNKVHDFSFLDPIYRFFKEYEAQIRPEPLTIIPFSVDFARAENDSFAYLSEEGKKVLHPTFAPLYKRVVEENYLDEFYYKHVKDNRRKTLTFRY